VASSPSSVLSASRPSLLGCEQPRIFTPPLRKLTPQTTLGFALIQFADEILGIKLHPWQQWLALHALELLPDGTPRFRTVVLLVARQSGKSTFLQVLALFFLYVRGSALVIGTAQNLDIAEEVWQGAVDIAQDVPELADEIERVSLVNGKKALELRRGERYKVQAANRRGGRGLSGDLVMLDELREHQSWDAWGAITKTTMARANAQTWAVSNAGDKTSVVLAFLRRLAHLTLGDPDGLGDEDDGAPLDVEVDDDSLAIFEWSAPPGCDLRDRDGWAQANPSLGHTITERAILAALRTDPEPVFRTEVLCQWVTTTTRAAIDLDLWRSLADPDAPRGDRPVFGVAVAPDAEWSAISVAWKRLDGVPQVMLADYERGTAWVPGRVAELAARWNGTVVVDSAARGLVPDAEAPSQAVQAQAHNALATAVEGGRLRHGNEKALTFCVTAARWKPSGDTRVLDRKGSADISPLIAAALALHGLASGDGPSVYEEREVLVL
jgi:phage terminase large subunit-like protein